MIKTTMQNILKYRYILFTGRTKQVVQNIKLRSLLAFLPSSMLTKCQTIIQYFISTDNGKKQDKPMPLSIPNISCFVPPIILHKTYFIF